MSGSVYQDQIREILRGAVGDGVSQVDPRHVEAWIRANHPTLDGLDEHELELAIVNGYKDAVLATRAESEKLARSFGL